MNNNIDIEYMQEYNVIINIILKGVKMITELEFLDENEARIHDKEMMYEGTPPIPNVGELVYVEGKPCIVKRRDFLYLSGDLGIDIRVSMICKSPKDEPRFSFD
jgi:hypothetical protein